MIEIPENFKEELEKIYLRYIEIIKFIRKNKVKNKECPEKVLAEKVLDAAELRYKLDFLNYNFNFKININNI